MAMSDEQFEQLVHKLEKYSRTDGKRYRAAVIALAVMGYAYIFTILIGSLALLALLVYLAIAGHLGYLIIKGGFFLLILIYAIVRSLWVKIEAPTGIPVKREQAPMLFAMLDGVSEELKAPKFHQILLTDDFNAGVTQAPKLGIFGWNVNYLLLGLPLMQAIPPDQFRAVIAHELGHISGRHSHFSRWIYRIRQTWTQLFETLCGQEHHGAFLFKWFFTWYAPYFLAYTFVLARADEYEADQSAVALAGPKVTAEMLINIPIKGHFFQSKYWTKLFEASYRMPQPPFPPFATFTNAIRAPETYGQLNLWVGSALADTTSTADTHPCLADRLTAIGYRIEDRKAGRVYGDPPLSPVSQPMVESAAEKFLGQSLPFYIQQMDQIWYQAISPVWSHQYAEAQTMASRLNEIHTKAQSYLLTEEEQFEQARITIVLYGNATGIPLLRAFAEAYPNNVQGRYLLGQCLLEDDNEGGIAELSVAMRLKQECTISACELILQYLYEHGRMDESKNYINIAKQEYEVVEKAQEERSNITPSDHYEPHGLPKEKTDSILPFLIANQKIAEAYLVRKSVAHYKDEGLFIIGIVMKTKWYKLDSDEARANAIKLLAQQINFGESFYVVALDKEFKDAKKRMAAIPGSLIYSSIDN